MKYFQSPQYLWLLAVAIPFVFIGWVWLWRKSIKSREEYIPETRRIFEKPTRNIQIISLIILDTLLILLLIIGLAHPERPTVVMEPVYANSTTVVAIDVSSSMKAEAGIFGAGGRIGAVKQAFHELLSPQITSLNWKQNLKDNIKNLWQEILGIHKSTPALMEGQPIALVLFAGEASAVTSPTTQRGTLINAFKHISTDHVPVQGSNFPAAIEESLMLYKKTDRVKILIILSDAEEEEGQALPLGPILTEAKRRDVKIFPVVVGQNHAKIPGKDIWTKPNIGVAIEMARKTGGEYFAFDDRGKLYSKLAEIFSQVQEASKIPVTKIQNLQPLCALLALIILIIRLLVTHLISGQKPKVMPA